MARPSVPANVQKNGSWRSACWINFKKNRSKAALGRFWVSPRNSESQGVFLSFERLPFNEELGQKTSKNDQQMLGFAEFRVQFLFFPGAFKQAT